MTENSPSTGQRALESTGTDTAAAETPPATRFAAAWTALREAVWETVVSGAELLAAKTPARFRERAESASRWMASADDRARRLHIQWFLAVAAVCVFLAIGIDIPVARAVEALPEWIVFPFKAVTDLGKSTPYLIMGTGLFLYLFFIYRSRSWAARALYITLLIALSGILVNVLKIIFGRARPKLLFREEPESGFGLFGTRGDWHSFPSGHTSTVVALGFGAYVLFPHLWRYWVIFAAFLGSTRVMSGNHFPSDVIAGAYMTIVLGMWLQRKFEQRGYALRVGDRQHFRGLIAGGGK